MGCRDDDDFPHISKKLLITIKRKERKSKKKGFIQRE